MSNALPLRRFAVHSREGGPHEALLVTERSFEAAAVAWVETWALSTEESEITVIVRDFVDGHERCFRLDTRTGEAVNCD